MQWRLHFLASRVKQLGIDIHRRVSGSIVQEIHVKVERTVFIAAVKTGAGKEVTDALVAVE